MSFGCETVQGLWLVGQGASRFYPAAFPLMLTALWGSIERGSRQSGLLSYGIPVSSKLMRTVIETPTFHKQAERLWSEAERLAFIDWIAAHPLAGDVIPGADGARKVRWSCGHCGKRGGVRVIYFNLDEQGYIVLITLYAKNEQATLPPGEIPHGY